MARHSRGWFLPVVPVILAVLLAAGCTDRRTPEEMKDSLVYGYDGNFRTFDPARQIYAQETFIIQQVLEPLVVFNHDLVIEPALATDWHTPDGCQSWVFNLREGVVFHDGTPFDAYAVQYHFDRILDPATAATRRVRVEHISSVEVVDDLTVRIHLRIPDCVFPETISAVVGCIPSPTAMQAMGDDFARNPVGTGPFEFIEWIPDIAIRLRKNHRHWNADEYHLERLEFRHVREHTTRLILLEQGVLDIASIYFAQVDVARNNPDMVLQSQPYLSIVYIGFNTQKPPFNDRRVRQAANYAVNKEEMIEYMFFGVGEPARGPIPSILPAFSQDVKEYPYDPEKARALLAEAGYPDGIDVTFWTPDTGTYWKATEGTVEALRKVGIRARVQIMDFAVYWDRFDEYITPDGQFFPTKDGVYDIYVAGWVGGETAHGYLEPLFMAGSLSNSSFYDNADVNRLLTAYKAVPDEKERNEIFRQIQDIVTEDAPWIFAMHGQVNEGVRHRVQGYRTHPAGRYFFRGVSVVDE